MSAKSSFDEARTRVEGLTVKPGNEELLLLYGLYKQATEGDNQGDAPTGFDFKELAKHHAWKEQAGKEAEQAMAEYVELVDRLIAKYS